MKKFINNMLLHLKIARVIPYLQLLPIAIFCNKNSLGLQNEK